MASPSHTLVLSLLLLCLQGPISSPNLASYSCFLKPRFPSPQFRGPGSPGRILALPGNHQSLCIQHCALGKHGLFCTQAFLKQASSTPFYESSHCSNFLFCFDFIFASDIFSLAVGQILAHRIVLMKNSFLLRLLTAPSSSSS